MLGPVLALAWSNWKRFSPQKGRAGKSGWGLDKDLEWAVQNYKKREGGARALIIEYRWGSLSDVIEEEEKFARFVFVDAERLKGFPK